MTIRIGLDGRFSGVKNAGLGRYTQNLLAHLPFLVPPSIELVYFLTDKAQWSEIINQMGQLELAKDKKLTDILAKIKVVFAPIPHYSLAEQTKWPKILAAEKLTLLHIPHFNAPYFYRGKIVVTIHDLLWHEKKGLQVTTLSPGKYFLKYLAYRLLVRKVVRKAEKIIAVSQQTKKILQKYYPWTAKKTVIIYNGLSKKTLDNKKQLFTLSSQNKNLLYVGSLYPHKNVSLILRSLVWRPEWHLHLVSARDAFWQKLKIEIEQLKIGNQVTFWGKVSEQTLQELYRQADVLVQPSLSEGFGFTGIEALSFGTPVAASNIPVFQEIYGQTFCSFSPLAVESLIEAVEKSFPLKTSKNWQKLAGKQVSLYDFVKMSRETLAVYEAVLAKKNK